MARHVKIVYGNIRDGDSESSEATQLSRKIYDTIATATTIHAVSVEKYGKIGIAVVVFDD